MQEFLILFIFLSAASYQLPAISGTYRSDSVVFSIILAASIQLTLQIIQQWRGLCHRITNKFSKKTGSFHLSVKLNTFNLMIMNNK